jgi:glycosyltransferase involved in cell wall biosynthesis
MKIGITTSGHQKSSTGIGNYIYNLIENLPIQPNDLYIIRHPLGYDYNIPNQIVPWAPKFSNAMLWSWFTYIQKNMFKDLDIIHTPTLCLFPKKPHENYILTVNDVIFKLFPEHCTHEVIQYTNLFFKRNIAFADKIIAISNTTKQDLIDIYKIPESKIEVIYLAASEKFKPLKEKEIFQIKEKYNLFKPFVLYVGTIEPRKNIPTLLHAFSKCLKKVRDVELILAGGLGWNYDEVFNTVKILNISDKVRFLGYIPDEDLPAIYNAAKVFVFPSYYEGFGLPPLEAMQCGTPVITSNVSSLPEVVGKDGMMIDPSDENGFCRMLIKILTDDEYYQYQKEYGKERSKLFSWKKTAEKTYTTYKDVIEKSRT